MDAMSMMMGHNQRRFREYGFLQGQRVVIRTKMEPDVPEVLWFLAQELDCVIFAQRPREEQTERGRFSFINAGDIEKVEILDPGPVEADLSHLSNARFVHARIAVHALNAKGNQHAIEITGTEPRFGGIFRNPNHALGWALRHVHSDMKEKGLLAPGDNLPLHPRYKDIPPRRLPPLLDAEREVSATLLIHCADFSQNQFAGITLPSVFAKEPGTAIRTTDHVLVWGFEALCQEAIEARILNPGYKSKTRRNRLGQG